MSNNGFIRTIILIVIALVIAAYFGFDLSEHLSQEQAAEFVAGVWEKGIRPVFYFIWGIVERVIAIVK